NAAYLYMHAYMELHHGRPEQALVAWTRILQIDPSETLADRLIERLRTGEQRILSDLRTPEAFADYIPLHILDDPKGAQTRRRRWWKWNDPVWKIAGLMLVIALAVFGGIFVLYEPLMRLLRPDPYADAAETLPEPPSGGTVTPPDEFLEEEPRFSYADRDAALAEYNRARDLIAAGKVNQARYLLGKLELSNAGFEIKNRVLFLREAIPRALPDDFRDPVSLNEILAEPYMYRGAQVLWVGVPANFSQSEGILRFDFRLQPEQGTRILVLYPYEARGLQPPEDLESGREIQVLGTYLKLEDNRLTLQAESIQTR
ncbi:MAG: hypothetical protein KDK27_17255, partial [Leptospiraceae bacterium]|nr:hypothetical protein [Leptospiraceae bacterium]